MGINITASNESQQDIKKMGQAVQHYYIPQPDAKSQRERRDFGWSSYKIGRTIGASLYLSANSISQTQCNDPPLLTSRRTIGASCRKDASRCYLNFLHIRTGLGSDIYTQEKNIKHRD
ncbi:MAG: hypothetical protein GY891_01150, partial [Bacteroidetes bacterium]|nr:hypothetical protein [Bacteroidota bacterium]